MDRIERHDVLNAVMLSFLLMGMTLTMLWGARGIVGAASGDDVDSAETIDILANQADDSPSGDAGSDPAEADAAAADSGTPEAAPATTTPATTIPSTTSTAAPTTTEAALHPPNEVIARVGNGAERSGVAGAGTNILASAGYATLSPKNARTVDVSSIYYLPGYEKDAAAIAQLLSVALDNVKVMPEDPGIPVGDAQVVALLGRDTPHGN